MFLISSRAHMVLGTFLPILGMFLLDGVPCVGTTATMKSHSQQLARSQTFTRFRVNIPFTPAEASPCGPAHGFKISPPMLLPQHAVPIGTAFTVYYLPPHPKLIRWRKGAAATQGSRATQLLSMRAWNNPHIGPRPLRSRVHANAATFPCLARGSTISLAANPAICRYKGAQACVRLHRNDIPERCLCDSIHALPALHHSALRCCYPRQQPYPHNAA